jgi:hypothetical protein
MKHARDVFLLVILLSMTRAAPTVALIAPEGQIRVVTSAADSGAGTLRQALLDAQDGDIITFDPTVFPPGAPATILVDSELPEIHANNLTLDASNAGVILDGSHLSGDWQRGLQIVSSQDSAVRGLRIANFSGPAIDITGDARNNVIGGDRAIGSGPSGQGNQFIHNLIGATVLRHEGDYLMGILEYDLMPLVDGVSWHPFYRQSPEYEAQYYYDYPATVQEIKDVASAHGFGGEYMVEEIGWSPDIPGLPVAYSESVAAKYWRVAS